MMDLEQFMLWFPYSRELLDVRKASCGRHCRLPSAVSDSFNRAMRGSTGPMRHREWRPFMISVTSNSRLSVASVSLIISKMLRSHISG